MEDNIFFPIQNWQISQLDFFIRLLICVGIGFLIGLEREHASRKEKEIFAGVRTFVFVVLFGFLSTFLSLYFTYWILIGSLLFTFAMVLLSFWVSSNNGKIGGTTEFTVLIAFILGCITLLGHIEISLAITVLVLTVLTLKIPIQSAIGKITQTEMFALVKFVILGLLIFPFLPNKHFGPFDMFNPKELGWIIILTSGIGFIGYILMKFSGNAKGIIITGILGGLVSSTVVTWIFSKKSKEAPFLSNNCAVAILSASTIMTVRVLLWLFIFNKTLIPNLLLPLILIFLAGFGTSIYYFKKHTNKEIENNEEIIGEPLNLKSAMVFGLLYTLILYIVNYANTHFNDAGLYITTGISAITDIDAITISIAKIASDQLQIHTAQNLILLATLSNTLVKIGITLWNGSQELKIKILWGFGYIFIAGFIGFLLINL